MGKIQPQCVCFQRRFRRSHPQAARPSFGPSCPTAFATASRTHSPTCADRRLRSTARCRVSRSKPCRTSGALRSTRRWASSAASMSRPTLDSSCIATDFGLTLGVWGFGPGPYLVVPIFGPSSVRDAIGIFGVEPFLDLNFYIDYPAIEYTVFALRIVNRARGTAACRPAGARGRARPLHLHS